MKESYTIKRDINLKIKVGDSVRLWDGSSLTCDKAKEDVYIVFAYPELTGDRRYLKEITGRVLETHVKDKVSVGVCGYVYLQDIVVQVGTGIFRTCSGMVRKI